MTDAERLEAQAAALQEVVAQFNTWQPIETAPRDGTRILLGRVGTDDRAPVSSLGWWVPADDDGPDCMGNDAGFCDWDYSYFNPGRSFGNPSHQYEGNQPTHWMPLPSPPATGEAS